MGRFNKSIGIGVMSMESHDPYITIGVVYVYYNLWTVRDSNLTEIRTHRKEHRFKVGIKSIQSLEKKLI